MLNVLSQILATGITAALFYAFYKHCKKDAEEERERKRKARQMAWAAEIERAGRRMMQQDAINKILKENAVINENNDKKDAPIRKATGFYSGADAQKILKCNG